MPCSHEWPQIETISTRIDALKRRRTAAAGGQVTALLNQAIEAAEARREHLMTAMFERLNCEYGYLKTTVPSDIRQAA